MKYIDQWLTGLGLEHLIPLLKSHGITTPKKLAQLSLRDMYEVVGVESAEDRKTLYYLIERLRTILRKDSENDDTCDTAEKSAASTDDTTNDNINKAPKKMNVSPLQRRPSSQELIQDNHGSMSRPEYNHSDSLANEEEEDLRVLRQRHKQASAPTTALDNSIPTKSQEHHERKALGRPLSLNPARFAKFQKQDTESEGSSEQQESSGIQGSKLVSKVQINNSEPVHSRGIPSFGFNGQSILDNPNRPPSPIDITQSAIPRVESKPGNYGYPQKHKRSSTGGIGSHEMHNYGEVQSGYHRRSQSTSPPPAPPPPEISSQVQAIKLKAATPRRSDPDPPPQTRNNRLHDEEIADMAIRVIVKKRPINGAENGRGERDILDILPRGEVQVHEPKTKVDLTKVVETHSFFFDDAFEAFETNELVYSRAVSPLVKTIFQGGKASCFAYGQTGSGKTFTMMGCKPSAPMNVTENAGLYVLAAREIFHTIMKQPSKRYRVFVSCFEIYAGKLFDLLNDRGVVKCLEDSKQQVQLPGLTEHVVGSVDELLHMMSRAHMLRSVGSTGANMESSRSHQILQLALKTEAVVGTGRQAKNVLKEFGKLTFIDLAGSERGADTTHNNKQTRMEGAEINTSLLALKEVIRSLERKSGHTPFRGSKLTQVLKDSFVGENTRTCMVACVSPSSLNSEHTLNTLRYADRVKEHQGARQEDSNQSQQRPNTARPPTAPNRGTEKPGVSRPVTADVVSDDYRIKESSNNLMSPLRNKSKPARPLSSRTSIGVSPSVDNQSFSSKEGFSNNSNNSKVVPPPGIKFHRGSSAKNVLTTSKSESTPYQVSQDDEYVPHYSVNRSKNQPVQSVSRANNRQMEIDPSYYQANSRPESPQPSPPTSPDIDLGATSGLNSPDRKYDAGDNALMSITALASDYNAENDYQDKYDSGSEDVYDEQEEINPVSNVQKQLGSSTVLLQKTLEMLSAHKSAIAEMVEVMKDEMELVQNMEQADERDSDQYAFQLQNILESKALSILSLRQKIHEFQQYREVTK